MRIAIVIVCGLGVALVSSLAAPGAGGGAAKVLCWNDDFPPPTGNGDAAAKRKPKRCTFFERGESSLANAVQAHRLRWGKWGGRSARGTGKVTAAMGQTARVKVKLSKPVSRCGHRAYSQGRFRVPKFGTKTKWKLWIC